MVREITCPVCDKVHKPKSVVGNGMGMSRTCANRYANFRLEKRWHIDQKFKDQRKVVA